MRNKRILASWKVQKESHHFLNTNSFANILPSIITLLGHKCKWALRTSALCLWLTICFSHFDDCSYISLRQGHGEHRKPVADPLFHWAKNCDSFLFLQELTAFDLANGRPRGRGVCVPAFPVASFNKIISQQLQAFIAEM